MFIEHTLEEKKKQLLALKSVMHLEVENMENMENMENLKLSNHRHVGCLSTRNGRECWRYALRFQFGLVYFN
jgi:hypothetical protein